MPFVIDDIVGLVGIAIAIPGLVQVFVHSARWLSNKLEEVPLSIDKKDIEEFIISVDCGTIRATLETIEDIYLETYNENSRKQLFESANQLWLYMVEVDKRIRDMKTASGNEKKAKRARNNAVKAVQSLRNLEEHLRAQVQTYVVSHSIRSRFELRDTLQFVLVGNPHPLPHSAVSVGRGNFNVKNWNGEHQCLVERKSYRVSSKKDAYDIAVGLARSMQFFEASKAGGLPELVGFQPLLSSGLGDEVFRFIFAFPRERVNPRSLRNVLLDPVNKPSPPIPRNYRFILPRILAEAVYQVHEQKFVHKRIRPESILLLEPAPGGPDLSYPKVIGAPILTDWEYARKLDHVSTRGRIDDWTLAMYQHPDRQALPGQDIEVTYHIGHDIYSLGVCLLEIGLWDSFIVYENNVPKPSQLLSDAIRTWKQENSTIASGMEDARIEQKTYILLAEKRLAYDMGEAYSALVVKCLTYIEKGFGNLRTFVDHKSSDWKEQETLFAQEIRRGLRSASKMGSGIYNTLH